MNTTLLPAIRSYVGDWTFYATTLSFIQIKNLVKEPDEVHERKKLSDWIQREAIQKHSDDIAEYIIGNNQRFLGSLIIGVYGGQPNWAPLRVDFSKDYLDISEEQKEQIEGRLGFLHLTGTEKLFAIDGQHRVAGIKKALEKFTEENGFEEENVSAIFVAHDPSSIEGRQRTRRLFTTLNKKAKPISKSAIIALDEDNGFAVVTRELIDNHWLFEDKLNHISYTSTGSIVPSEKDTITSVVGLYEIVRDLYPPRGRGDFEKQRPGQGELESHFTYCRMFIDILLEEVHEYKEVFIKKQKSANYYRNHLLFRPIGQRVFARSVQLLVTRGNSLSVSVEILLKANPYLDSQEWWHILWDPVDKKMVTNKIMFAESQLLTLAGQEPRTDQNKKKLEEFIASLYGTKE